jgi:hypothetical protein
MNEATERQTDRERERQIQTKKKLRKNHNEGKKMYKTCERIEKKQEIENHFITDIAF